MRYPRKRKTKQVFLTIALLTAIIFTAFNLLMDKTSEEVVIAKVNHHRIVTSDIEEKLSSIFDGNTQNIRTPDINTLPREVLELLAKEIYLEKELTRKARESGIENKPDVVSAINKATNDIIRRAYLEKLTADRVTKEAVNNKYLRLSEKLDGKKEYLVSHIVVKEEKEALRILKTINDAKAKNDTFIALAAQYSIDESSANNGGKIDYILEDDMIDEIMQVIKTLDDGAISQPIKSQFGWHLVKIDDVRDAQLPPFAAVQHTIESQLSHDALKQINATITDNITVEILIPLQEADEQDQK